MSQPQNYEENRGGSFANSQHGNFASSRGSFGNSQSGGFASNTGSLGIAQNDGSASDGRSAQEMQVTGHE